MPTRAHSVLQLVAGTAAMERVYVSKEEQAATFRTAKAKGGNLVRPR